MMKVKRIILFSAIKKRRIALSPATSLRRPLKLTQLPSSTLTTASSMPTILKSLIALKHTAASRKSLSSAGKLSTLSHNRLGLGMITLASVVVMNITSPRDRKRQVIDSSYRILIFRIPVKDPPKAAIRESNRFSQLCRAI